ncbi:MAG: radical SAM protein [bacterium]|nr:radical SAM protein [bacterium]
MKRLHRFNEFIQDVKWVWRWPNIPRRYITWRKIINYYHTQLNWLLAKEKVSSHPYYLTMELTNICNLKCPECPTGQGHVGRKHSRMTLKDLERLLDELSGYAFIMDMHNWGEPLLHKDVFDAVRLCEDRNVMTVISTNFNVPFNREKAEKLVNSGLAVLGVSLDGPDQESYQTYRVNGKLELALDNILLVKDAKERLGSATPRIVWSYLVFRHNQHLVEEARAMAELYGIQFNASKGYSDNPEWMTTEMYLHPVDDVARRGRSCRMLYNMAVVNSDLGVPPCCAPVAFYSDTDFGDVREGSYGKVWNGTAFRAARKLFKQLGRKKTVPVDPVVCEKCDIYTSRKKKREEERQGVST